MMAISKRSADDGLFAVLPLRDIVVFPHMIVPLFVGREKSIKALEEVMGSDKQILLATQMNASDDDPEPAAIYDVGTLANVLQLLKLPDGTVKVLVEGASRAKINEFTDRADYHEARASLLPEPEEEEVEIEETADAGPEIVSLEDADAEEAGEDEEIPDVEDVEDVEDLGDDDADTFLEEDEDEDESPRRGSRRR